jgi:hypothetical protein
MTDRPNFFSCFSFPSSQLSIVLYRMYSLGHKGVFKGSSSNLHSSNLQGHFYVVHTSRGYSAPFKGWKLEEMKRAKIL